MSQGARTRVQIGSATPLRSRQPRSMNDAFGPYSRLTVESTSDRVDRIVGRFCFVIVVTAILALIVNAAFGGI